MILSRAADTGAPLYVGGFPPSCAIPELSVADTITTNPTWWSAIGGDATFVFICHLGCLVGKFEASLVEDSYFIYLPSEAFGRSHHNQITSSMAMAAPGRGNGC